MQSSFSRKDRAWIRSFGFKLPWIYIKKISSLLKNVYFFEHFIWNSATDFHLESDIICSVMRTPFWEQSSRKPVSFEEQICPRINIRAYISAKWRLLFLWSLKYFRKAREKWTTCCFQRGMFEFSVFSGTTLRRNRHAPSSVKVE